MMSLDQQIHVFIISDNRLFTDAVALSFSASEEISFAGSDADLFNAIAKIEGLPVDIVLVDTGMESVPAVQAVLDIKRIFPEASIIAFGLEPEGNEAILEVIEAGASGYILQDACLADLLVTIDAVHRKQTLCSPSIAASIIERITELSWERSKRQMQTRPQPQVPLTPRELQVLELIKKGLGNKQIAKQLNISLFTAKNHVHNILIKIQVRSRRDAITHSRLNHAMESSWLSRSHIEADWISDGNKDSEAVADLDSFTIEGGFLQPEALVSADRQETNISHRQAIERVILTIHDRLGEVLSLDEIAEIAMISPYHFNRVFRQVTGIPPVQFLGAARLEAAKRLLLTTDSKVIDICFEVGYNSLGTFTRRFTELVGLPPCRLRQLAASFHSSHMKDICDFMRISNSAQPSLLSSGVTGNITAPDQFNGPIFVGLFPAHIPQGRPLACGLLTAPGPYQIAPVPDGRYHAFALAFDWSADALTYLLYEKALRGTSGPMPVVVRNGQVQGRADIMLQTGQLTDPPILLALPFLLAERMAQRSLAAGLAAG